MICIGFFTLFGISSLSLLCKGQIISPPDGSEFFVLNGSNVRIEWSLQDGITINYRSWVFKRNSSADVFLGSISSTGTIDVATKLYDVDIEKPATLVLNNVNASYEGRYEFTLITTGPTIYSVLVIVPVKPTVTVDCPSVVTASEGDDVTCVCKGEGGNPAPANVTWFKDGVQIGETGTEERTLTLSNIDRIASGTYKCVAQSHTLTDERSIEMIVYHSIPMVTSFTSNPENAVFGEAVVIICEAIAVPLPSYTIIHNDTDIVSFRKTYIITHLEYGHSGSYKCIARNNFGNRSKTLSLSVTEIQTTNTPTSKNCGTGAPVSGESKRSGTEWYIVMVSLLGGVIIGILLSYIVWCSSCKFRSSKHQSNPEPQTTEVDPTYQGLDLNKMNKEDNYQSLTGNYAASNDVGNGDESAYTELNKIRDVENDYQSLSN